MDRINQLLGVELTADNIRDILESLSFEVEVKGDTLKVTVPSYRQDVMGMADLAEEVARIYGYDKIPMTLMENTIAQGSRTREQILTNRAKNVLAGMVYTKLSHIHL